MSPLGARLGLLCGVLGVVLACAGGGADVPDKSDPSPGSNPPAATDPPPATPDQASAKVEFDPAHRSLCRRENACGLLAYYPIAQVESEICEMCGETDEMFCVLDWPASDVPSCQMWSEMEACVWKTSGAKHLGQLLPEAVANVAELQRRKEAGHHCQD